MEFVGLHCEVRRPERRFAGGQLEGELAVEGGVSEDLFFSLYFGPNSRRRP